METPRILLADDHPEMLIALGGLLAAERLGEVVGAVADGEALLEAAHRLEPDVIIMDISMPRLNGLDATRVLRATIPQSKVIILTIHRKQAYVTLAFKAGARGYLLKTTPFYAELSQALLHVQAGDRYLGLGVREEGAPSTWN